MTTRHMMGGWAGLLFAVAAGCATGLWTGCAGASGRRISREMVSFVQPGVTTRAEVVENLGRPVIDLKDQRAVAYLWEKIRGTTASTTEVPEYNRDYQNQGGLLRPPESETHDYAAGTLAYCVAFDTSDRVIRAEFVKFGGTNTMAQALSSWAKEAARK